MPNCHWNEWKNKLLNEMTLGNETTVVKCEAKKWV